MAIYHLSVKTISRSAGRSAPAAAAYRAGSLGGVIAEVRTGEIHDYTRKGGVVSARIMLPSDAPDWASDRAQLWNNAELAEKRKNSTTAREFEIALPSELSAVERERLAHDFASELVHRHGCAADVTIHEPNRDGDDRNHHAHILISTRRLGSEGFTEKTRELDDQKTGEIDHWRQRWAELQNTHLAKHGHEERVDHRSLADQGIDRQPTQHLGPAATGFERRTGEKSQVREAMENDVAERLEAAKALGELQRQESILQRGLIQLDQDIAAAKRAVADQQQIAQQTADLRKSFEQDLAKLAGVDQIEKKLASLEAKGPQPSIQSELDELRRQVERERKRREEAAAREAAEKEKTKRHNMQRAAAAMIATHAQYCESHPESASGKDWKNEFAYKEKITPRAMQLMDKDWRDRMLLEHSARELIREGKIESSDAKDAGIRAEAIDPRQYDMQPQTGRVLDLRPLEIAEDMDLFEALGEARAEALKEEVIIEAPPDPDEYAAGFKADEDEAGGSQGSSRPTFKM